MEKAKVLFTREITPEKVVELFEKLGKELPGKVAVKIHSGEAGNQNYLPPAFWKPMVDKVQGTAVECNTAYPGARNATDKHKKLLKHHGWEDMFPFDLMDAEGPDEVLPIEGGLQLDKDIIGKNLLNYDSLLVLAHFKGHPMGGYGGALKQLSIGCASTDGKAYIHSGGKLTDQNVVWNEHAEQDVFLESMADAAGAVVKLFGDNAVYVNVMKNLTVDCDCCEVAEDPCMEDIGILISEDPVAIDQACIDLVDHSEDPGRDHFWKRVSTRHGVHTIEAAAQLGYGTREYELIEV